MEIRILPLTAMTPPSHTIASRAPTKEDALIANLLGYWQDNELLSPSEIPGYNDAYKNREKDAEPLGDRSFSIMCRSLPRGAFDKLPWDAGWPLPRYKKQWMHTVYFGVYPHSSIESAFRKVFNCSESDYGGGAHGKFSAVCAFTVTDTGMFVVQNGISIGTASWAVAKIKGDPGRKIPSAAGFFEYEEAICERIKRDWLVAKKLKNYEPAPSELDDEVVDKWTGNAKYPVVHVGWPELNILANLFANVMSGIDARPFVVVNSQPVLPGYGDIFQADSSLCNYTLSDLRSLAACFPAVSTTRAFDRFLSFSEPNSPHDLISSEAGRQTLITTVRPPRAPAGRWPSAVSKSPNFRQQAGINLIFEHMKWNSGSGDEDDSPGGSGDILAGDLFSINGPPGTGKTFMIRELLAAVYTDRARLLARYDDPGDAFSESAGGTRLHTDFERFGIVLASNNNQALKNITLEIPTQSSVDPTFMDGVDLFGDVSTRMLDAFLEKKQEGDQDALIVEPSNPPTAWGLCAATLGNQRNVTSFWWRGWKGTKLEEKNGIVIQHPSIERIMLENEARPPSPEIWQAARGAFLKQLDRVDELTRIAGAAANGAPLPMGLVFYEAQAQAIYDEAALNAPGEHNEGGAPWASSLLQEERARLFGAAANLHRTFLAANARTVRPILEKAIVSLRKRGAMRDLAAEEQRNIWATFFLAVPLISTTFASLQRFFPFTPQAAGVIPWLVIDEASQSTPQQAVGAIYCARRVVVLGDTQQLPPVVTVPQNVHRVIRANHIAEFPGSMGEWLVHSQSLQAVSDSTSRYGAFRETSDGGQVWVGFPLLYHLRCESPIFEMFASTFYANQLSQGTPKRNLRLPAPAWIHVESCAKDFSNGSKYSSQEGIVAGRVYDMLLRRGLTPNDILVISPFRDISSKIGSIDIIKDNPADYKNHGTVHCSQGREAAAVLLLLGTSPTQVKSREWCCRTAGNLLNVAFTRAKTGLYIVGNADMWGTEPIIQRVLTFLPKKSFEAFVS